MSITTRTTHSQKLNHYLQNFALKYEKLHFNDGRYHIFSFCIQNIRRPGWNISSHFVKCSSDLIRGGLVSAHCKKTKFLTTMYYDHVVELIHNMKQDLV